MSFASATGSLDGLWRAHSLPMWLALIAAAFFAVIVLVTLLRAEKSVANGALTVITLLAIGVAAAATLRVSDTGKGAAAVATTPVSSAPQVSAALPALSCLDELAGDMVLAACEKVLFGSADAVAAAVSVSAGRIDRLTALGNVASADKLMTPDLLAMRRAMERDRYGLIAYVLQSRDRCTPDNCPAYASFTDHKQIAENMDERTYEGLVTRASPGWIAQPAVAAASGAAVAANPALAGLPASVPTGKPTTADFPSSASIPPISIMTETPAPAPKPPASANAQTPRPAAPKRQAAPKAAPHPQAPAAAAPVQLAPTAPQADN